MMMERLARKHFERGRQFELQERLDEAVEAYEKSCELEPPFADPYFACARIQAGRGQNEIALALLDRAVALDDDPRILEWRAYVNGRLQRYEQALADYRRVLETTEGEGVRVNLGRMLLALRRYDEAAEVLTDALDPSAAPLLDALPRYREFSGDDRVDDQRAVRYLFGATLLLGTQGDGGLVLGNTRYLLLTPRHVASTVHRLVRLIDRKGWAFDAVAGEGAHHGPVARALAEVLELPCRAAPGDGRVLLCSAVVNGADAAAALRGPWLEAGARVLHFALGFVPQGDPSLEEPHVVGFVNRCAVPWYRVEPWSRLEPDDEALGDEPGGRPGFRVGPPIVDPNADRVTRTLVRALRHDAQDPYSGTVLDYYLERHPQVRAFRWEDEC